MSFPMIERDIFCQTCNALIDHHGTNPEYRDNGYVAALLANDAVRAHREEGCVCSGWYPGPWSDQETTSPSTTSSGAADKD